VEKSEIGLHANSDRDCSRPKLLTRKGIPGLLLGERGRHKGAQKARSYSKLRKRGKASERGEEKDPTEVDKAEFRKWSAAFREEEG